MVVSAFSYFQYREISAFCQVEDCANQLFPQKRPRMVRSLPVNEASIAFSTQYAMVVEKEAGRMDAASVQPMVCVKSA